MDILSLVEEKWVFCTMISVSCGLIYLLRQQITFVLMCIYMFFVIPIAHFSKFSTYRDGRVNRKNMKIKANQIFLIDRLDSAYYLAFKCGVV